MNNDIPELPGEWEYIKQDPFAFQNYILLKVKNEIENHSYPELYYTFQKENNNYFINFPECISLIKDMIEEELLDIETSHARIGRTGIKLFRELPSKFRNRPYNFFLQDLRRQIKLKNAEYRKSILWWMPIFISLASLGFSLYSQCSDMYMANENKEKIKILKRKLSDMNIKHRHDVDSLWGIVQKLENEKR
jgi:hypothetical protein